MISSAVLQTICAVNSALSIGDPNGPANNAIIVHRRVVGRGSCYQVGSEQKWNRKFELDLCSQIQLPTDTQSHKCKFIVDLKPGYHVSDILGIQYSFIGGGEEICIDLILFTNTHFCRGRQYKDPSRQVRIAVHLAYLGQSIL